MHDYVLAYKKQLDAIAADVKLRTATVQAELNKPLTIRIQEWWLLLSPEERKKHYAMRELVSIFNTAPGLIGVALVELGWHRRRKWSGANNYRYWEHRD